MRILILYVLNAQLVLLVERGLPVALNALLDSQAYKDLEPV